jgi:hypothetical protein
LVAVLLAASQLLACNGNKPDPNAPNAALEQRDTEMKHEPCDLEGGKGLDANGDGRPDIVQVFSGQRERCRAVDINMDTVIDRFVYFDDAGNKRRVESGFDRDTRPDEIAYYEGGQLVRKERETNNDQRIDTWSYFEGGRVVREERDSTGDGFIDQWWQFNRPDQPECALVVTDGDGDGKPDEDSQIDTCADEQQSFAPKPAPKKEEDDEEGEDAAPEGGASPEGGPSPDEGNSDGAPASEAEGASPSPSEGAPEGGEPTP